MAGSDFTDPDEILTPVDNKIHEPISQTVRHMRRQIRIMLVINIVAVCAIAFLVYWQAAVLSGWRARSREIQLEILERVRAHDHVFESCPETSTDNRS